MFLRSGCYWARVCQRALCVSQFAGTDGARVFRCSLFHVGQDPHFSRLYIAEVHSPLFCALLVVVHSGIFPHSAQVMAVAGQQEGGVLRPSQSQDSFHRNVPTSSSPFLRPRAPAFSCGSHTRIVSTSSASGRGSGRAAHRSASSDMHLFASSTRPSQPVVSKAVSGSKSGSSPSVGAPATGNYSAVHVPKCGILGVSAAEVEPGDSTITGGGQESDSGDLVANSEEDAADPRDLFVKPDLLRTFRDKCSPLNGVAFSPDMQYMYTSADDCSLHIYSIHRGVCTRILHANKYGVHAIKILPHALVSQVSSSSGASSYSHVQHPPAAPPPGGAAGATCLCLCGTKASPSSLPAAAGSHTSGAHRGGGGVVGGGAVGEGQAAKGGAGAKGNYAEGSSGQVAGTGGASDFAVRLWNLAENRYLRSYPLSGKVCRWTGLSLSPRRSAFVCCSEDAQVRLFALDKEQPLWVRCVSTSLPLAAFDSEGLVLAVYEGQGRFSFFDAKHPQDPFLQFSVAKFLRKGAASLNSPSDSHAARGSATRGGHMSGGKTKSLGKLSPCSQQNGPAVPGPAPNSTSDCGYYSEDERPTSLQFVRGDAEIVFGTTHERVMFFDVFRGELQRILEPRRRDASVPSIRQGNPSMKREETGQDTEHQAQVSDTQPHIMVPGQAWVDERERLASGESVIRQMLAARLSDTEGAESLGVTYQTPVGEEETPTSSLKRQKTDQESCRFADSHASDARGSPAGGAARDKKEQGVSCREKAPPECFTGHANRQDALFHLSPLPLDPMAFAGQSESEATTASPVFVPGLSPCGRYVAVGSSDRYVHVFDILANEGKGMEVGAVGRCDSVPEVVLFNSKFDVFLTAGLNVSLWKHALCRKKACA